MAITREKKEELLKSYLEQLDSSEAIIITDYRGRETLGSWAPLKVKGLDWAMVGKMDLDEAYRPINELARATLIQSAIILVAITLIVMYAITKEFRQPAALAQPFVRGLR